MKIMTKNIHAAIIWQNILNTPNLQCIKCYTAGENNPWRFWNRFASKSLPIRNKYKGSAGLLRSFSLLAISRARAEQNQHNIFRSQITHHRKMKSKQPKLKISSSIQSRSAWNVAPQQKNNNNKIWKAWELISLLWNEPIGNRTILVARDEALIWSNYRRVKVPVGEAIDQKLIDEVWHNSVNEIPTAGHGCIFWSDEQNKKRIG